MTDYTDLCKRLRHGDHDCQLTTIEGWMLEAADAIERLEADNAALRLAASKVEDNLSKWADDGSRPDEWLLREWAGMLNAAMREGKG